MITPDRLQIVRDCFGAYETCDSSLVERHLADGFTFSAPPDVGIDREAYFERCWPNSRTIDHYEYARLVEVGDEVLVTYEATRTDGTSFRNTEIFAFEGDKVTSVEVYWGWDLD